MEARGRFPRRVRVLRTSRLCDCAEPTSYPVFFYFIETQKRFEAPPRSSVSPRRRSKRLESSSLVFTATQRVLSLNVWHRYGSSRPSCGGAHPFPRASSCRAGACRAVGFGKVRDRVSEGPRRGPRGARDTSAARTTRGGPRTVDWTVAETRDAHGRASRGRGRTRARGRRIREASRGVPKP
jgi:hypothetical protein